MDLETFLVTGAAFFAGVLFLQTSGRSRPKKFSSKLTEVPDRLILRNSLKNKARHGNLTALHSYRRQYDSRYGVKK